MKRFIIKIIIFAVPVIISMILIENYVRTIPNSYSYKIDYLNKNAENIEILILGHSQVVSINPSFFKQKCFNMAMSGQGLAIDEFIVKTHIEKLENLKSVILPLSYQSLIAPAAYGNPYRITGYKIFYHYNKEVFSKTDYEIFTIANEKIKHVIKGISLVECDSLGVFASPASGFQKDAASTANWHNTMEIDTKNKDRLENIIDICNQKNIKVVLFTPPITSEYQGLINADRMAMMYTEVNRLTKKFDNCFYLDYSQSDICKNTSYFYNCSHLNKTGVDIFSRKLIHDIDSLGIVLVTCKK